MPTTAPAFILQVDGEPANAVPPIDDGKSTLILTAEEPAEDYVTNELVATGLPLGKHTLSFEAYRGWEQWALNGFSVSARPPQNRTKRVMWGLGLLSVGLSLGAWHAGKQANWGAFGKGLHTTWHKMPASKQLLLSGISAAIVGVAGWFTWAPETAGIYRKLSDFPHLALTAATATTFYFAPSFFIYIIALIILTLLLSLRPARGVALVAFTLPFYVTPKPMLGYRFSPVEIFILAGFVGYLLSELWQMGGFVPAGRASQRKWALPDVAVLLLTTVSTLSLLFTKRLDVATNEWRVIIIEPALFYFTIRAGTNESGRCVADFRRIFSGCWGDGVVWVMGIFLRHRLYHSRVRGTPTTFCLWFAQQCRAVFRAGVPFYRGDGAHGQATWA